MAFLKITLAALGSIDFVYVRGAWRCRAAVEGPIRRLLWLRLVGGDGGQWVESCGLVELLSW